MPSWYRAGTVTVTNNSKNVTGTGTAWTSGSPYVLVGGAFRGPDGRFYEVEGVAGATVLTLVEPYLGTTANGQAYGIMPTLGLAADLAVAAAQLINTTASLFNSATPVGKALLTIADEPAARSVIGVDQAITDMIGGAWLTAGVVVSPSAGALANANASVTQKKIGRTVFFTAMVNIISNGSAGGSIRLTMPFSANKPVAFVGRENAVTGAVLQGFLGAASNVLHIYKSDNSYPGADNRTLIISGLYEATA